MGKPISMQNPTYNGLAKHIKDDMVHNDKPNSLSSLWKLMQLLTHNIGNDVEKIPRKPALPEPLETSPNRSPTPSSQTTSPAKVLPNPNRTTTNLALPRERAQLPNRRSPPLLTFP